MTLKIVIFTHDNLLWQPVPELASDSLAIWMFTSPCQCHVLMSSPSEAFQRRMLNEEVNAEKHSCCNAEGLEQKVLVFSPSWRTKVRLIRLLHLYRSFCSFCSAELQLTLLHCGLSLHGVGMLNTHNHTHNRTEALSTCFDTWKTHLRKSNHDSLWSFALVILASCWLIQAKF